MLKKRIPVGNVKGTEIYVHISLILSTILAWAVLTLITKPALGFEYGPVVYGPVAFMAAVVTLMAKIGYEIGRLMMLQNQGMEIKSLVLLPLSGLIIYEEEHPRRSLGFWSSMIPILPLLLFASMFTLVSLSPTSSEFQTIILRGIALVIILFALARLVGAFAVDRLNTVHSLVWRFSNNLKAADIVHAIWRNITIISVLAVAISFFPEYRWLEFALAVSIAWGLYDGVLLQRRSDVRLQIERLKASGLGQNRLPAG